MHADIRLYIHECPWIVECLGNDGGPCVAYEAAGRVFALHAAGDGTGRATTGGRIPKSRQRTDQTLGPRLESALQALVASERTIFILSALGTFVFTFGTQGSRTLLVSIGACLTQSKVGACATGRRALLTGGSSASLLQIVPSTAQCAQIG